MENKIKIYIPSLSRAVRVAPKQSLLEGLLTAKVHISHSCGGFGSCGTCLVRVRQGIEKWPPRNEVEAEMAADRDFQKEERLACQSEITWDPDWAVTLDILSFDEN